MPSLNPRPKGVIEAFERAGWMQSDSGGGCQWLTKEFPGGMAAITDDGGLDAPQSWRSPCILGFYDREGQEIPGGVIHAPAANIYTLVTRFLDGRYCDGQ